MGVENGSSPCPAVDAAVTVTGARTVAPAKNRCTLATFDLPYITFYYNQKLLLYRTAPDFPFPDAVARMTAALADALRVFYPLAGRIRQLEDGALAVEGDEGAEVFEAEALGVAVDDLAGGDCSDEAEKVMQLLVPYTGVMNLEGLRCPLLAVQVSACHYISQISRRSLYYVDYICVRASHCGYIRDALFKIETYKSVHSS
jgi:BAHD acyltransferase